MSVECPEHPECRENLIRMINDRKEELSSRIGKKMSVKSFWVGIGSVVIIISIIVSVGYAAYADRMRRTEATQAIQERKLEQRSQDINMIRGDIRVIKTRQDQIITTLKEMKEMLQQLTNKQVIAIPKDN